MQNSVMCPECESTSLSAKKNESEDVEIICLNCGAIFKPGEGITSYKTKQKGLGALITGYLFAVLSVFLFPIIFLPLAIICGMSCIVDGRYRIIHGIVIITLAFILANYGAKTGGWGFGLSYSDIHF